MTKARSVRPRWAAPAAWVAILFGVATILVGGKTLVADPVLADDVVPFVLWSNFVAGFAYVVAGYGILGWKPWAAWLSAAIAVAALVTFVALGVHVALGGAFAATTVGAMLLRSLVWIVIAAAAWRALGRVPREAGHHQG